MSLTPLTFVFARAQSGSVGLQPKSKLADGHVIDGPTQSLTTTVKVQGLPGTAGSLAVHVTVFVPNGNSKDGVTTVPLWFVHVIVTPGASVQEGGRKL